MSSNGKTLKQKLLRNSFGMGSTRSSEYHSLTNRFSYKMFKYLFWGLKFDNLDFYSIRHLKIIYHEILNK